MKAASFTATLAGALVAGLAVFAIDSADPQSGGVMPVLALITLPTLGALAGYELTRGYASRPAVGSALTFDRGTLRIGVPLAVTARGTTTVSLVSGRF